MKVKFGIRSGIIMRSSDSLANYVLETASSAFDCDRYIYNADITTVGIITDVPNEMTQGIFRGGILMVLEEQL